MVLNNIEKLLEKYENGETSLKEEQQLKHYFTQETVAPHLEMYKPMFVYFSVNQEEQFTKDVPLNTRRTFNYKWVSVAAVAVLMLGFYFSSSIISEDYTELEQQLAFNQFKESMQMVSKNFNNGTAQVSYLGELDKGISQMSYLGELEKGTSHVNYLNEVENTTNIIFK